MTGQVKVAKFAAQPWFWDVGVVVGPRDEANVFLDTHTGVANRISPDCEGLTAYTDNRPVFVWVLNLEDIPTLVHELMHVIFYILRQRGVTPSEDSEEAYTYTMSDLLGRILSHKKWKSYQNGKEVKAPRHVGETQTATTSGVISGRLVYKSVAPENQGTLGVPIQSPS